ncbi:MAG TPA: cytochrome c peroxidase [Blastocatellia bacterium]|nr:cytochrome c peroxidase [Blastocatellia bacterium]
MKTSSIRFAATCVFALLAVAAFAQNQSVGKRSAAIRLGQRLFKDARFSSPRGDLQNSCSSCHLQDEDPQGMRAHTDFFARSWVPWRAEDPRREELRNSPTLVDSALMPRLHFDGEFGSLEDLVKGTLAGRPMGWLPGEQEQAFDRVYRIILRDAANEASYRQEFEVAYNVQPTRLSRKEVIERVAQAISDYMRTLKSSRTAPYDSFVKLNNLDEKQAPEQNARLFADRILRKISMLEAAGALKLSAEFDASALNGMKIFFGTGNCIMCHAPPLFTDNSFHNTGISQSEYDQVNGEGSFARLEIPSAAQARRPSPRFRETPSRQKPGCVDLGYWNFVDLKTSPLRRATENDDRFLERMIATFKTPTLRNLAFTGPYMHTGGFSTLESALAELKRLSELARAGRVRDGDDELARIQISDVDIAPLVAFLKTLNEDLKPGRKD